jgi:hypothetical protein
MRSITEGWRSRLGVSLPVVAQYIQTARRPRNPIPQAPAGSVSRALVCARSASRAGTAVSAGACLASRLSRCGDGAV